MIHRPPPRRQPDREGVMSDYFQNGVITNLSRITSMPLEPMERELRGFARTFRTALFTQGVAWMVIG